MTNNHQNNNKFFKLFRWAIRLGFLALFLLGLWKLVQPPIIPPTAELTELINQIEAKLVDKKCAAADSLVLVGLHKYPNNPKLLDLQKQIIVAQIPQIIDQATAAYNKHDYTTASSLIQQGLTLDPNNATLLDLQKQIIVAQIPQIIDKATAAYNKHDYTTANSLIQQGLTLDPNNATLLDLQKQIIVAQIPQIIDQATAAYNKHDYTTASSLIQQGLTLDPKNATLLNLQKQIPQIAQITDQIAKATAAYNKHDYTTASSLIQQGLKLDPKNAALIALQKQIKDANPILTQPPPPPPTSQIPITLVSYCSTIPSANIEAEIIAIQRALKSNCSPLTFVNCSGGNDPSTNSLRNSLGDTDCYKCTSSSLPQNAIKVCAEKTGIQGDFRLYLANNKKIEGSGKTISDAVNQFITNYVKSQPTP